ncbi:glycine--tRNA ligase [Planctomycetales bacterium ZRK34]|nr:glycine--tRNA ligase [Planctomycetales bacterium ZRK34]
MDEIVALCRRRGFIWQSSEVYGGINGFWDYGPLGAQLKKNLKDAWWQDVIKTPPAGPDGADLDIVPVDCTIIMNPKVWEASGHVGGFNDPMVDCAETKKRYRADHISCYGVVDEKDGRENAEPTTIGYVATLAATEEEFFTSYRENEKKFFKRLAKAFGKPVMVQLPGEGVPYTNLQGFDRKIVLGPDATEVGTLTEPREFNLMFETYVGAIRDEESKAYLRPETAQGIFTQFWNVVDTARVKIPFGMAQIGKAFRNEVTPRNFTFRSREFEQMEIEFFIRPETAGEWYQYWRDTRYAWWQSIGLAGDNLTLREHDKDELSHYAKEGAGVCDVEYRFPFTAPGYGELEGIAHRSDFDLKAHATACGKGDKLMYRDPVTNEKFFPHVIEPSAGADRGTLAVLCEAFTPTPDRAGSKYVMKFVPRLAPIKAAIFPLVNKDGMPEIADKLYRQLRNKYTIQTDAKQSIGKRYARMDEAGTPYCFTIDGDTATDQTVTVRDRDTAEQTRISLDKVESFLAEKIGD